VVESPLEIRWNRATGTGATRQRSADSTRSRQAWREQKAAIDRLRMTHESARVAHIHYCYSL
jgi:hypothetical protein